MSEAPALAALSSVSVSPKTAAESLPASMPQPAVTAAPVAAAAAAANQHPTQHYTAEYLAQLLKDKKQLAAFPNVFLHLERLVDEEVSRVRVSLFQFEFNKSGLELPENDGSAVQTITEKVYVPVQEYPDYNFVGRILGPRGMTAKQLEQETGCKIMVRGRGSMRDKKKEEANRGKPNWEHLSDSLHVLIQCEDTAARCKAKLARAKTEIEKLLVPAPEGEDELKRKQLMELAIINGTYRAGPNAAAAAAAAAAGGGGGGGKLGGASRLGLGMGGSPLRSPTLAAGAPIILSPNRSAPPVSVAAPNAAAVLANQAALGAGLIPGAAAFDLSQTGLLLNGGLSPEQLAMLTAAQQPGVYAANPYAAQLSSALASPLLSAQGMDLAAQAATLDAGGVLRQTRLLGQAREHPYQRPTATLKTPTT